MTQAELEAALEKAAAKNNASLVATMQATFEKFFEPKVPGGTPPPPAANIEETLNKLLDERAKKAQEEAAKAPTAKPWWQL